MIGCSFLRHPENDYMTSISLDNFRHTAEIQVRWGDMDALGHVNNATYLTYLEQARINYVRHFRVWDGSADQLGLIVARVVIDYKVPLVAGDRVAVHTRVSRLGTKSFETEQAITRLSGDEVEIAAVGAVTLVVFDYARQQSVPIPDAWRAIIIDYEPGLHGG